MFHGRDDLVGDLPQDRAIGQHGDDHVRVCRGGGSAFGGCHAFGHGLGNVETGERVTRRCKVFGHGTAHVAQPHESDGRSHAVVSHPCNV